MGRVIYVSSVNGDDANSGYAPEKAFRSLRKVNQMEIQRAIRSFWSGDQYLSESTCTCMQVEQRRLRLL